MKNDVQNATPTTNSLNTVTSMTTGKQVFQIIPYVQAGASALAYFANLLSVRHISCSAHTLNNYISSKKSTWEVRNWPVFVQLMFRKLAFSFFLFFFPKSWGPKNTALVS